MARGGDYRNPVTVQRVKASATRDGFNLVNQDDAAQWETYVARRCKLVSMVGKEFFAGDQVQATSTHLVTLRRDSLTIAITTDMRLICDGSTFHIDSISSDGTKRNEVVISCTQRR